LTAAGGEVLALYHEALRLAEAAAAAPIAGLEARLRDRAPVDMVAEK
jgi:hypothetical protein